MQYSAKLPRWGFTLLMLAAVHLPAQTIGMVADSFFVINSPSAASRGADSILTFDSFGNSAVFFGANHNFQGLRDIACSPHGPRHIVVSRNDFSENIAELLEFNPSGKIVKTIPFGTPGEPVGLAFDRAGNLYVAEGAAIFKNGALFVSLPSTGVGKLAVDSGGNLYITNPFSSQLFRSDPLGHVTLFADASKGVNTPFGLAIDSMGNIFVANNPGGAPAFILKFDKSGTASSFATGISFQPGIRSMTFHRDDNLYAALADDNEILKFDTAGNSSVFADVSKQSLWKKLWETRDVSLQRAANTAFYAICTGTDSRFFPCGRPGREFDACLFPSLAVPSLKQRLPILGARGPVRAVAADHAPSASN